MKLKPTLWVLGVLGLLLLFGCTTPNTQSNQTENGTSLTNGSNDSTTTTGPVVYLLHDPQDPQFAQIKSVVSSAYSDLGVPVKEKCVDLQMLAYGKPSQSSAICRNQSSDFDETMSFLENHKQDIKSYVLYVNDDKVTSVPYTPVRSALKLNLCNAMSDDKPEECNVVVVPDISAVVYGESNITDNQNVLALFNNFRLLGLPLNYTVLSDEDTVKTVAENYNISYEPFLVIRGDSVMDDDQKSLLDMLVGLDTLQKHGNDYILVMNIPEKKFIGPKEDVVNLDVYVMAYCPHGLQMEKAVLPVKELLGDRLNLTIKFVNYAMHGEREIVENTRQYCIQKEEPDKYFEYLRCFIGSGDASSCMANLSINEDQIEECMNETYQEYNISTTSTARFPPFPIYDEECKRYGIRGSPSVVFDGVPTNMPRVPELIKEIVCERLKDTSGCEETLSTSAPKPGFGWEGSQNPSSAGGFCG